MPRACDRDTDDRSPEVNPITNIFLFVTGAQLVHEYLTCRGTRDSLSTPFIVLSSFLVLVPCVGFALLVSAQSDPSQSIINVQSAERAMVYSSLAIQLISGALMLFQAARLRSIHVAHSQRLPAIFGANAQDTRAQGGMAHPGNARVLWRSNSRDSVRSSGLNVPASLNSDGLIETESSFERAPAHLTGVIALVVVSALLIIVTSVPAALADAISAFVLYSVCARLSEIALVIALLHKFNFIRMHARSETDYSNLDPSSQSSALSSCASPPVAMSIPAGKLVFPPVLRAKERAFPPHAQLADLCHGKKGTGDEAEAKEFEVLSNGGGSAGAVWTKKKWPWVITPTNDAAVEANVISSAPVFEYIDGSSSGDSTDSSGTYFV